MTELFVVERRDGLGSTTGLVVRVHAGCLRIGDKLSAAVDAAGQRHQISLTCVEISLSENLMVDQLEENYGGYVVVHGMGAISVDHDWTLLTG